MTQRDERDTVPPSQGSEAGGTPDYFEASFRIRPAEQEDARFIVETTAKVRQPRRMPWTAWAALAVPEASRRLAVGRAFVAEAAGALLGFVLANEGGSVEMLYVKRGFRGLGIGKDLLAALGDKPIVARAPTPSWRAWTAKRGIRWRAPDGPPQGIRGQQLGNNARSMAALQVAIDRYEAGEFD